MSEEKAGTLHFHVIIDNLNPEGKVVYGSIQAITTNSEDRAVDLASDYAAYAASMLNCHLPDDAAPVYSEAVWTEKHSAEAGEVYVTCTVTAPDGSVERARVVACDGEKDLNVSADEVEIPEELFAKVLVEALADQYPKDTVIH